MLRGWDIMKYLHTRTRHIHIILLSPHCREMREWGRLYMEEKRSWGRKKHRNSITVDSETYLCVRKLEIFLKIGVSILLLRRLKSTTCCTMSSTLHWALSIIVLHCVLCVCVCNHNSLLKLFAQSYQKINLCKLTWRFANYVAVSLKSITFVQCAQLTDVHR